MNDDILERLLTRRQVLVAGIAVGTTLLAGCGSRGSSGAGWSFVDDLNRTVQLDKRPTRIAACLTPAAALQHWGVTPVGVFGPQAPESPWLADFPWSESNLLGSVYGEIDTDKLLALKAELIVSHYFPQQPFRSPVLGFRGLPEQIANVPVVWLNGRTIATAQIARFETFVRSLGVETESGRTERARRSFTSAAARLSRVAKTKAQLRIISLSGDQNAMFVAKLDDMGDLRFYRQLGVPLVSARTPDHYWDKCGWNGADMYPADGILYDARPGVLPLAAAKRIAEFEALPAVRTNQVDAWQADLPPSYEAYAKTMDELATMIASWRRVT